MGRIINGHGFMIETEYALMDRSWHCRIRGERLTMCGLEFTIFHKTKDALGQDDVLCERCEMVIDVLRRSRRVEL